MAIDLELSVAITNNHKQNPALDFSLSIQMQHLVHQNNLPMTPQFLNL
jgi:hypothetical protein